MAGGAYTVFEPRAAPSGEDERLPKCRTRLWPVASEFVAYNDAPFTPPN
jgi:hypothetical protein